MGVKHKLRNESSEDRPEKHAELSDQIRHVEAVIKLLDPDYNLGRIAIKRRKPSQQPMTTLEHLPSSRRTASPMPAKRTCRALPLASLTPSRTMRGRPAMLCRRWRLHTSAER